MSRPELRLSDLTAGQELGLPLLKSRTSRCLEDDYGQARMNLMQYCNRHFYEQQEYSGFLLESTILRLRLPRDDAFLAYKRS